MIGYILLALFIISLIVVIVKYVLFHPQTNSVVSIIVLSLMIIFPSVIAPPFLFMFLALWLVPIIDCIRDFRRAPEYYETDLEMELDKFYLIKSLTSLVTVGLARYVFFFIVDPAIRHYAASRIKKLVKQGGRVYGPGGPNLLRKPIAYHSNRQLMKLVKKGKIISSQVIFDQEKQRSRAKLDALYPQKLLNKVVDMVAGDKEMKAVRKQAEYKLSSMDKGSYLATPAFMRLPELICAAMSSRGTCPLSEIKYLPEVASLGLLNGDTEKANSWQDPFIVLALMPLVQSGEFEDNDYNDKDPFDNHAYRYTKSTKAMVSQSPESNPALALDDDDD